MASSRNSGASSYNKRPFSLPDQRISRCVNDGALTEYTPRQPPHKPCTVSRSTAGFLSKRANVRIVPLKQAQPC